MPHPREIFCLLVLFSPLWPSFAQAQCSSTLHASCESLCGTLPPEAPCRIAQCKRLAPDATIDCGGRDILVESNGRLIVENGFGTLRGGSIVVGIAGTPESQSRRISATSSDPLLHPFGIVLEALDDITIHGYLEANSDHQGGEIRLTAGGTVAITHSTGNRGLSAVGTAANADGGTISIRSEAEVDIADDIEVDSGASGISQGGQITIEAIGSISLAPDAHLKADGHSTPSESAAGGKIRVSSKYATNIQGFIRAVGRGAYCDGGEIEIVGDPVLLSSADLTVQGGFGSQGGKASGGSVSIVSGPDGIVASNTNLDMTGGAGGGGLDGDGLSLESGGDINLGPNVLVDTRSRNLGGDGGTVILEAAGTISLLSGTEIDARGLAGIGAEGVGGEVQLTACSLNVLAGSSIDAGGFDGGEITLFGTRGGVLAGSVSTAATGGIDGEIALEHGGVGSCSNGSACRFNPECTTGICSVFDFALTPSSDFYPAPEMTRDPRAPYCL